MKKVLYGQIGIWVLTFFSSLVLSSTYMYAEVLSNEETVGYQQKNFMLGTFWDPPITNDKSKDLETFRRVKDAYFNLLTASNTDLEKDEMKSRLELASEVGIRSLIGDSRISNRASSCIRYFVSDTCPPYNPNVAEEVITHYRSVETSIRDTILGYYLQDEPCGANLREYTDINSNVDHCNEFVEPIKNWIQYIKREDPTKLAYINLHPLYENNRDKWSEYLDTYLSDEDPMKVPDVVSYDQYPFICNDATNELIPDSDYYGSYFFALETIREKAGNRPLWVHPYVTKELDPEKKHDTHLCEPDKSQLQFMTFVPLAYGVKGLVYFTYATAPGFKNGLIDNSGQPTKNYYIAQSINRYISKFWGPIVMRSSFEGVFHKTIMPVGLGSLNKDGFEPKNLIDNSLSIVADLSSDSLMVGLFQDNQNIHYGMVVNKSLDEVQNITVTLHGNHKNQLSLALGHEEYLGGNAFRPIFNAIYDPVTNTTSFKIPALDGGEGRPFKIDFSLNIDQTTNIYEDAEDGSTKGWSVYDTSPNGATISNIEDNGNRVIQLEGDGIKNGYLLGDWIGGANVWNNRTKKTITWRMKYDEDFIVYINVETEKGQRYLYYTNKNGSGIWKNYIHHGLGSSASDGTWRTVTRDLEEDLKDIESDNSIIAVNAFLIRGSGLIDDIQLLPKRIYEHAEDKNTNGWRVYDNTPTGAIISNEFDTEKGDRVIKLKGSGTKNGYILGDWIGGKNVWNNRTEKIIRWSMKYNEDFVVYINVETEKGQRYLYYTNSNKNKGQWKNYIHHGLGENTSDGKWRTVTRDLEVDLKDVEHDNSIIAVNAFLIRGSGLVDDIELLNFASYYDKVEDLELRNISLKEIKSGFFYEGAPIVDKGRVHYVYESKYLQPRETEKDFCESRGLLNGLNLNSKDEIDIFGYWLYGANASRDTYNMDFFYCFYNKNMIHKNSELIEKHMFSDNGNTYYAYDELLNWDESKNFCEERGLRVPTITSEAENDFVSSWLGNLFQPAYWLAGTDENHEGVWQWITTEEWSYENWDEGEPNNYMKKENNLEIYRDTGRWNDVQSNERNGIICESR